MNRQVAFYVRGVPAPQGSKTKMPNGAMLEAGSKTGREKVKNWRADVKEAAIKEMGGKPLLTGPLAIEYRFRFLRPKSRKRTENWHSIKPDLSKLIRATEDAMSLVVYKDDCSISATMATKSYTTDPAMCGAFIFVKMLDHEDEVTWQAGVQ